MTPQQIAEKIMPHTKLIDRKKVREELVQLITTLQKETWDEACKAGRDQAVMLAFDWAINNESGTVEQYLKDHIEAQPIPPFNPEK